MIKALRLRRSTNVLKIFTTVFLQIFLNRFLSHEWCKDVYVWRIAMKIEQ